MKRFMKRFIAVVLITVMTLGTATVGMAADENTDNAHFTFTDLDEEEADLYVEKHATSALDGYTIPDVEFTFVLKWDQDGDGNLEFADNAVYYVYNEDGTQVWNADTSDGSFRTSSTGRFTLKDGQYAKFEFAGQVKYEVTELEIENFIQTLPAGGQSASGTVKEEGSYVVFENLYIPPSTEGESTQLAVRKDIAWPDGYEMPDLSGVNFTFKISIDDAPYANRNYTIYDSTMTTVLGTGTTDSEGTFTITGSQLALFEDIEVGVDYEVTEISIPNGWSAVGTTSYAGATVSPIIYTYFTNNPNAFTVEKERTDGVTGPDGGTFTFKLTDESGQPVAGATYYLYDSDTTEGSAVAKTTGTDGTFTLQAGQRALFMGLVGDTFKIEEVADSDEWNYTVMPSDGYTVNTSDADTECIFTNEELTDITIKKYGKENSHDEKDLLGGAEFTIYKLTKDGDPDNDNDWDPYPNDSDATKTTGQDGTLTFTDLPSGTYKIVETKTPAGYVTAAEPIIVTLPYTMTEQEVTDGKVNVNDPDCRIIYSDRDGVYYFYDLTYDVDNTAVLQMPNTGGRAWIIIALALCGAAAAFGGAYIYRRRHSVKEGSKA